MADTIYHNFFARLMAGGMNLAASGNTMKLALYTDVRASIDPDATVYSGTNEVANGNGYTTGGYSFTNTNNSVTDDDANNWTVFDIAEDAVWTTSTITARWADLYNSTDTNNLICCYDFGTNKSSSNGTFTVQFNANGCVRLA